MLGSLILYLKGMRIMMFQLSGYYCKLLKPSLMPLRGSPHEVGQIQRSHKALRCHACGSGLRV